MYVMKSVEDFFVIENDDIDIEWKESENMSDFEVDIVKGLCEASHFHPELEILFIIEGNATVNVK